MGERTDRAKAATLDATLELLAERGFVGLGIEGIAARAGVSKATIYRHWPALPDLVIDAVTRCVEPVVLPDTGSLRGDLVAVVHKLVHTTTEGPMSGVFAALMDGSERDAELAELQRRFTAERRRGLVNVLARARDRGELRDGIDVELAAELVAGPVFYHRFIARSPFTRRFADELVDLLLPSLTQ